MRGFFCIHPQAEQAPDDRVPPGYALSTLGFPRIDGFAFDQHRDVFLDLGHPGFGLSGVVDPVQDRVAIGAIKNFEEAFCLFIFRQRGTEIVRHLRRALGRIGGVPAPVLFGTIDLVQSRRLHAPHLDKLKRPGAVFLGPFAGGLARREADQPIVVIETVELAIDPTMTKRRINRLWL
jgi:hypothetical protein